MCNLVIYTPCTSRCFKLIHKPLYPQIDHLTKTDPKFRDAIEVCLQLCMCYSVQVVGLSLFLYIFVNVLYGDCCFPKQLSV